jgi:tetratricopeptide (TPR) repeat protein
MANDSSELSAGRLSRLLGYLDADGANLSLLSNAAEAALGEGRADLALDLLSRHAALGPLGDKEINLAGLAALQTGDFAGAQRHFDHLVVHHPDDPNLGFNLAWALASQKRFADALARLGEPVALLLPQAAMLRVQLLHELGQFDEAGEAARRYVEAFPICARKKPEIIPTPSPLWGHWRWARPATAKRAPYLNARLPPMTQHPALGSARAWSR